jgi:hypothetical protein
LTIEYYRYSYPDIRILNRYNYIEEKKALFNPSIVKYKNRFMAIARQTPLNANINDFASKMIYSELDDKFTPKQWRDVVLPKISEELAKKYKIIQYEDARFFIIEDRLFSLQTFVGGVESDIGRSDVKMSIIEWDENMNIISFKIYTEFSGMQKNWYLIHMDQKNYMITDFNPLRYYEIDLNDQFNLSNRKEINHNYNYVGTKVYSISGKKIKCAAHFRNPRTFRFHYIFRFFEIDFDEKTVTPITDDMSFTNFYGLYYQYPHFINKIDDKLIITLGMEDRESFILELIESKLL